MGRTKQRPQTHGVKSGLLPGREQAVILKIPPESRAGSNSLANTNWVSRYILL